MTAATAEANAFEFIFTLVYERCGVRLHEGKRSLVRSRLGERMRDHGFDMLEDYCDFLQREANEDELTCVVDALTTNFTRFLRGRKHFDFMVNTALPGIARKGQLFTVWSAGCATGEEPYSIAFYLADHFPEADGWDWQVMATDVSTAALARARAGIYPSGRATTVPGAWMKKYCQRGVGEQDGQFRIKRQIADRVTFQQMNLLESCSFRKPFELIFCRNVMIYFDRRTREQLVRELARCLVPGGYLLVGHSEILGGPNPPLHCVRQSIYRNN